MAWSLRYASGVSRELRRLDRPDARFVLDSLDLFASRFSPAYESRLLESGRLRRLEGQWKGFFRLRLRTFRVIYRKYEETLIILVVRVSHRKDAYRT